jgi:hypothetical protein
MLIAAAFAVAAVIGATISQRRAPLAKLKLEGFSPALVWRTVVLESGVFVGVGSLAGRVLALLGQRLLDQALRPLVNYPVEISLGIVSVLESIGLVIAAAVAIIAVPGLLAVRVPGVRCDGGVRRCGRRTAPSDLAEHQRSQTPRSRRPGGCRSSGIPGNRDDAFLDAFGNQQAQPERRDDVSGDFAA